MQHYDKIIFGAGLYGLYAALSCGRNDQSILLIERDPQAFDRATYINQARVHMGYHYPRSLSTAAKSAHYFERFVNDYEFCILSNFDQIYATSSRFSWTNAPEFVRFCRNADIRCEELATNRFFKPDMCDGAFLTTEYTYDAHILRDHFLHELSQLKNVQLHFSCMPEKIVRHEGSHWEVVVPNLGTFATETIFNTTYAGVNNIHALTGAPPFAIKYELCEIILCEAHGALKDIGITVMDGPFFSLMPFGRTGLHSLTSVTFTPHLSSYESQPTFPCQSRTDGKCRPQSLANCNSCDAKPASAWPFMSQLAHKYLKDDLEFTYHSSLFSMKPILKTSEIDDSRPTVIKKVFENPTMISALSGKINTVYDLDQYLA